MIKGNAKPIIIIDCGTIIVKAREFVLREQYGECTEHWLC